MHKPFLLAALKQAWLGRGMCAPNPAVGAVAVKNNKIIAQAFHLGAGTPHAEQILINELPKGITDLTIYVTLEPCNHWGRTPPCVESIINYGVTKVVYAYKDPNPIICKNNTPQLLKESAVEVLFCPIDEINEFYKSYQHWTTTGLPFITAKLAQTLDGKIAGTKGKRILLSNNECNEFTHKQRLVTDLILTTAKTINNDDPMLNVRLNKEEKAKIIAILDRDLSLKSNAQAIHKAKHCYIFYDKHLKIKSTLPNCTYYPISVLNDGLDLEQVIKKLGSLGYHDVWVEAGSTLFNQLHLKRLVNQTYIYLVPKILGSNAIPAYIDDDIFKDIKTLNWNALDNNMVLSINWNR